MGRSPSARHIDAKFPEVPIPKTEHGEVAPSLEAFAEAGTLLHAISEPVRLRILWWLARGERSVTELCSLVGMRQQAVTHHLNIVRLQDLVACRRIGIGTFIA
jgi:ArsR family transcriptional regulator